MNRQRLLDRFLAYVMIDTTADPSSDSYPSSPGQLDLGKLLVAQLKEIGVADVHQDAHGLVWAAVPATTARQVPTIAFNSHMDTSPETSGANVRPQVIENYAGGDIRLPGDPRKVITVADNDELDQLRGSTLITTDGTTLLGGDDKGGIAVIVEAANYLIEHPEIEHGPIRILFTCDEEIGHGVDHVDLAKVGATACYTLDGAGANEVDVETFSADLATVSVCGTNIHPSIAKNRMVNAVRAAGDFLARLPRNGMSPETTDGRNGFLHPYDVRGGVAEVTLRILLRDFDTAKLEQQADMLRNIARQVESEHAGASVTVDVIKQYRNMGDGLSNEPRTVEYAVLAHRRLGREPKQTIVRGGTDGSQLTELGLPTPNLSTGQHNPHSPLEWACLDQMVQAVEVVVELAKVWCEKSVSLLLACTVALSMTPSHAEDDGVRFFETKIRPLFAANCYKCHGAKKQESGLRLDTYDGLIQGGDSGPAIEPESSEESLLIEAVGYENEELKMPPDQRLTEQQIDDLKKWIDWGVPHPDADKED